MKITNRTPIPTRTTCLKPVALHASGNRWLATRARDKLIHEKRPPGKGGLNSRTAMQQSTEAILAKLRAVRKTGNGWLAQCPVHDDRHPSLAIAEGDDGRVLVKCHAGCATQATVAALGLRLVDLMPANGADVDTNRPRPRKTAIVSTSAPENVTPSTFATARAAIVDLEKRYGEKSAMWVYHNVDNEPIGVIVRWDRPEGKKDIRPVSRNGKGWVIAGMPAPRPLYCLPALAVVERVFVVEGEKCVEAARSIGLVATTSPHGSGSAAKADWSPLGGKQVVILPDNDQAPAETMRTPWRRSWRN